MACSSAEEVQLVVVINEITEPHERRSSVLWQIGAHSAWVSTCTSIQQNAELVVVDFLIITSNLH